MAFRSGCNDNSWQLAKRLPAAAATVARLSELTDLTVQETLMLLGDPEVDLFQFLEAKAGSYAAANFERDRRSHLVCYSDRLCRSKAKTNDS